MGGGEDGCDRVGSNVVRSAVSSRREAGRDAKAVDGIAEFCCVGHHACGRRGLHFLQIGQNGTNYLFVLSRSKSGHRESAVATANPNEKWRTTCQRFKYLQTTRLDLFSGVMIWVYTTYLIAE